ncbi:MAG: hypothetical protein ACK5SX_16950 [Sandaracinobacter sp.]
MLAGLVWDSHGRRMSPSHGGKRTKRYRYYVSQTDDPATADVPPFRVSATDLESKLIDQLRSEVCRLASKVTQDQQLTARQLEQLQVAREAMIADLAAPAAVEARKQVRQLVRRIEVGPNVIGMEFQLADLVPGSAVDNVCRAEVSIGSVRIGKQLKLIVPPCDTADRNRRDPALIKLLVQAHRLKQQASNSCGSTFKQMSEELGYSREYAADLLRISYLAPDIQARILDGSQPEKLTRTALIKAAALPLDWALQREALGFA